NQLFDATALESSFGFNMVAIVRGQPKLLSLKEILQHFIDHRREVVSRRSRFDRDEAFKRFNVVFGLMAAIDSIDRVIEIIRKAKDTDAAKSDLMSEKLAMSPAFRALAQKLITFTYETGQAALGAGFVRLNEAQAVAILEMRLSRLTGLERDKLGGEGEELRALIERLQAILASEKLLLDVIVQELEGIKKDYAEARRTEIQREAREMQVEDLIAEEEMVITVSHLGYVKRNPVDLYRAQRRGGRGKTAATTRDEDFVEQIFVASTHSYVLVFTDRGKVYWLKVHEIPQAGRATRGKPIVNLIRIAKDEKIAALLVVPEFVEGRYVVMATARGYIKKTDLMAFANPRPSGLIATTLDEGDTIIGAQLTDGKREILLATRQGLAIRFAEEDVRPMGRNARGVHAIKFKKEGDVLVGMVVPSQEAPEILTVCAKGYGKRTPVDEYRLQGRAGSGIINVNVTDKTGEVAGICAVSPDEQIMAVTDRGMMIRVRVRQISEQSRYAQGVRIISVEEGESVASLARIAERDDDDEGDAAPDAPDAPPEGR
ncbi:MAG: DNA gyrase subunit A, partial [Deltaproteobacteria bacterium]|nr:DNA gyrase subunit A [Deltaproteobacteria bacterium]